MKSLGTQVYRFDGVELDLSRGCLTRDGEELAVRQKSIRLLSYLLEERHRLLTKEELVQHVWKGMAVSDDALVQLIKEIRQCLGDDHRRPRFIKTVPRAGYRFIANVEEFYFDLPAAMEHAAMEPAAMESVALEVAPPPSVGIDDPEESNKATPRLREEQGRRWDLISRASVLMRRHLVVFCAAACILLLAGSLASYRLTRSLRRTEPLVDVTLPPMPGRKPLAIMYFENRAGAEELDWLREGLADMLITDLSRSTKLNVLSRQQLHLLLERTEHKPSSELSLDEALEIARRTGAEALVMGSFATLDGKIRIEVQLHDAGNGQLLAAEHLVADRPNQILTQIDLLSLKLASHLGAAPAEKDGRTGLAEVMTNNLEAYRYYSLALEKAQALHNRDAIGLLERAVSLDPQFAMAHARIGYTYAVTWGLADKGKPYLEKAFKLSDRLTDKDRVYITAWYAIANLDYPGAGQMFRQLIAQYPTEIEPYWRLGRLLLGEEKYDEAIGVLKRGLVVDPEAKDVYNALGVTYRDLRRHDEAIAMSQRYVQLAPDEPNAHDSLALAYQGAGFHDQALDEYNRALSLNPDFDVAILHLGNLYFQTGRYREAVRHYQRYIDLATSDWDRAWGYGRISWVHRRKGELEQAALAAGRELKYEKNSVGNSLMVSLERGDWATVKRLQEQLLTTAPYTERGLRPAQRSLSYLHGHLALKQKRSAEALEHFKKAISHRPLIWDIDSFEDCLANAYLELGQLDEAIAEYQRILGINPNYPLAQYHLGQAFDRKGQKEQARSAYEHFLYDWKNADADVPEILVAKRALAVMK